MRNRLPITAAILTVALLIGPGAALAQDDARRVVLRPRATETFRGTYGGPSRASDLWPGCPGYLPATANFVLDLDFDGWVQITVEADGDADTTLMVRGPSGAVCNDDADPETVDPEILTHLNAGEYYVYVGGFNPDETGRFQISFSHTDQANFPIVAGDRALRLQGISGGDINAAVHGEGCVGAVSRQPNHVLELTRPLNIQFEAQSASDLTLVVVSDSGTWCNDDGPGTLNPVIYDHFSPGLLRVHVGSHNSRVSANYTLLVQPVGND